jgi:hypothetical protein
MAGTWEATHICADLSDDGSSRDRSGCWQGEQKLHRFFLLGEQISNALLHPMDGPLQIVEVVEQFANELSVMRLYSSIESQTQCG